jgi:hypothetical protein
MGIGTETKAKAFGPFSGTYFTGRGWGWLQPQGVVSQLLIIWLLQHASMGCG